ncbi:MAG TPA: CpsB/CapC family capsule biosynthesis tyrosine phosphatase [Candidatus Bathyarchaeia archaeon]|nr:CpsB/CapC family capsule biosynthesis tyrosine phosphatase [Candidatus Bathyarchaeia archaeon]
MIDLHNHLLPDWDDGAADEAESLRMMETARADGITRIVLTPHVFRMTRPGREIGDLKPRMARFLARPRPAGLDLLPGAEVAYTAGLIEAVKEHGLTIAGTSYVFVELPSLSVPPDIPELVVRMMRADLIPIISHPERNAVLARSPQVLYDLVRRGALAQVTAQSLTGDFGRPVRRTAEKFLRQGLAHIIASDAHNAGARPPRLSRAVEAAAKVVGRERAEAMVTSVPAAILADE